MYLCEQELIVIIFYLYSLFGLALKLRIIVSISFSLFKKPACKTKSDNIYNIYIYIYIYIYIFIYVYVFVCNRSIGTALNIIFNDIIHSMDNNASFYLVLLDLSNTFDTLNHRILSYHLSEIGIHGQVHNWLMSLDLIEDIW